MNTNALKALWNLTQLHPGTSGARVATAVLLALYNGRRFPLNLNELRLLDHDNLALAMTVIQCDSERCYLEIHEWLNRVTGRSDFWPRFETLAYQYGFKGRRPKSQLVPIEPERLVILIKPAEAKSVQAEIAQ